MRTKIEIPDKIYSDLTKDALREHRSINDLILQSIRSAPGKTPRARDA
jgi:hypothetical protein